MNLDITKTITGITYNGTEFPIQGGGGHIDVFEGTLSGNTVTLTDSTILDICNSVEAGNLAVIKVDKVLHIVTYSSIVDVGGISYCYVNAYGMKLNNIIQLSAAYVSGSITTLSRSTATLTFSNT